MKENLKNLHVQRQIWKPHGKTSLCWRFYQINDNAKVDLINTQIMRYIFYYQNLVIGINLRGQTRKGLISYYKTKGITFLRKHMDSDLFLLHKRLKRKYSVY